LKVLTAEFVTSAAALSALREPQGRPEQGRVAASAGLSRATSRDAHGRAGGIPADGIAQVAFAGRSNVGKSTLLNALARRTLARTSAAPGKTRLANIYRLQVEGGPGGPGRWSVYFVDLPGYGYARGGADSAQELAAVAQAYYESGGSTRDTGPDRERSRGARLPGEVTPEPDPGAEPARRATLLLIDSRHPGLSADLQAHRWLTAVAGPPYIVATKIDKLSRSDRGKNLKELERVFGTTPLPVSASGGEGLDELWRLIARAAREQRP
jgi:GTP-binding protein